MKKAMGKRQDAAQKTRRRLLVAARKMLCRRDFAAVSVADIAKEAGTAVGTFYVYFKRKEDVIEELENYDFYHLTEIVNAMTGQGIVERLAYYCREFMRGIEEYGLEITRQWIRNNVSPQPMPHHAETITKYAFDHRAVRSILQAAVDEGLLKAGAPVEALALFVNCELYGLMLAWCMSDGAVRGSEQAEALASVALRPALEPFLR